jgi:hypothetical protein
MARSEAEATSTPPTKRDEEYERQDKVDLSGISNEDCRPTEKREKEEESIIQSTEKKDTTTLSEDEERFLAQNLPSNHQRTEDKQKEDDSEPKISQAQKVLEIAKQNCQELFLDQYGEPYAAVGVNGHLEVLPLNSKRFRNWLCKICYDKEIQS